MAGVEDRSTALAFRGVEARSDHPGEAEVLGELRAGGVTDSWSTSWLFAASELLDHPAIDAREPGRDAVAQVQRRVLVDLVLGDLARRWRGHVGDVWTVGGILRGVSWSTCEEGVRSRTCERRTVDCADLARAMIHPERGAYGVLAFRAVALVRSKQNRYVEARVALSEARQRLLRFEADLPIGATGPDVPSNVDQLRRAVFETRQQVELARSGTMSRIVENTLGRREDPAAEKLAARGRDAARIDRDHYRECYRHLVDGARAGRTAADMVAELGPKELPPVREPGSIAIRRWGTLPAIMEARARLLLIPMCLIQEAAGAMPLEDPESWEAEREFHRTRFLEAYGAGVRSLTESARAEQRHRAAASASVLEEHVRDLVQLRLHAALLFGDATVAAADPLDGVVPRCLRDPTLSLGDAIHELLDHGWDGNLISGTTAPRYIDAVEAIRPGYADWLAAHRGFLGRRDAAGDGDRAPQPTWEAHVASCDTCAATST